jgi:hypothetical protein
MKDTLVEEKVQVQEFGKDGIYIINLASHQAQGRVLNQQNKKEILNKMSF